VLALLQQLKAGGIHFVGWGLLPFGLVFFTLRILLFHLPSLRRAEVLVLPEKINFGGTIQIPDFCRHLFPDRHVVFMTFREPAHNPAVSAIWHDVENMEFINLSRFLLDFNFRGRRAIIPRRRLHDPAARWILSRLAHWLGNNPILRTYAKIFNEATPPEACLRALNEMLARNPQDVWADEGPGLMRYSMYLRLQCDLMLKKPSLPPELCATVEHALTRARGDHAGVRLCGLYLKKRSSDTPFAISSDGSSFESYLPAIRFLVSRGYQVLLTGDRPLTRSVAEEFEGMVVDSETLGLDYHVWRIYTALHTDIFIGDMGGGGLLAAMATDRPILGLNAFQFISVFSKIWLYYKHAYDHEGNHLPFSDMTGRYAFSTDDPGAFTIENNTADEILEATRDYVEEMENPGSSMIDHDLEDLWPPYSGFKLGNAHLSPAYVRNYYRKRDITAVSQPLNKAS
jgi:putative glycosyltransferase (TIGR04372 family)